MQGRTILLVEDQYLVAAVEQRDLERCGFSVLVAHSETTAIDLCRAHPEIDLILMDVELGTDRDGVDAAALILNERDLPIVFLSGHTQPEVVQRTERISSYGYVLKSTGVTVLEASIKMALRLFAEKERVREHQRHLHRSEASLAAMLESSIDLVWAVDRSYALLYANARFLRAAERWYGITLMAGDHLLQQIPEAVRASCKQRYDDVFAGKHRTDEIIAEGASGDDHFELQGRPITVQGQVIGATFFAKDITARRIAELALQAEKDRLAGIVTSADVGTWEWNVLTGELRVNASWARIVGHTQEEWQSATIDVALALMHPEDRDRAATAMQQHLSGSTDTYECVLRLRHKDGHWKWILDKGRLLWRDSQGRPEWVVGTHSDIDDLKSTERALRSSVQRERILLRELRHRAKNSFALISAMITLMGAAPESPETAEALEKIHARVLAIAGVYDHLDADDTTTDVRLDEYLCRIVPALLGGTESIVLECACEPITAPVEIAGPLGLIMTELVTNAVKYAFPDPHRGTIRIALQRIDASLQLELTDDGVGLPQGFDLTATKSLGFRIVQKLIQQIEGRMSVVGNSGTRYSIHIPCKGLAGSAQAST